jgi:hypothetical protein
MNLTPNYIGFDKPKAFSPDKWKLILIDLIPKEKFAQIQISKIDMRKKSYLHLELYEHFKAKNDQVVYNGFKENTFALGLIILELAFNINIQNLYNNRYHLLKSKDMINLTKKIEKESKPRLKLLTRNILLFLKILKKCLRKAAKMLNLTQKINPPIPLESQKQEVHQLLKKQSQNPQ